MAERARRLSLLLRAIWALCLIGAGANHARILLEYGFFHDYGVGGASAVYWTALTIIDPVIAVLLFLAPGVGIVATIVLMVTNVAHNVAATIPFLPANASWWSLLTYPHLAMQSGFLLFVLATARWAWPVPGTVSRSQ